MKFLIAALMFAGTTITAAAAAAAAAGAADAKAQAKPPLVIEEFADFECPYCAKGAKLMERVHKDYPRVQIVFKNRPLPMHEHAVIAAKAFLAMKKQNLGQVFHDQLFAHQVDLESRGEAYLYELAQDLGADVVKLKIDMASADVEQKLKDDTDEADRNAISGTPSFIVGKEKITGAVPYNEIKEAIERQL